MSITAANHGMVRLGAGGEFDLIRSFLPPGPRALPEEVLVGPGDDCAVVAGRKICLSSDLSVEGVHFRREWLTPAQIGFRATAAALSDLAAVAARPIGVLAAVALPPADAGDFAVALMGGVREAVEGVGGILLGGDLTRSPGPLLIDITAVGDSPGPILRSGARAGDEVWVTGDLGAAGLAVELLLSGGEPPPSAFTRFAAPEPRTREALWLLQKGVLHAMLDLSDGLAGDAGHLAAASGVAIVLERERIPIHPALVDRVSPADALRLAVTGGEDYELCFCAPAGVTGMVAAAFEAEFAVRLTRVGAVEEGEGVYWRDATGERAPVGTGGFQHFEPRP